MPLTPQPLPIQFAGGIDAKTDEKQVPATKLIDLENCVFTKQTTLVKRFGYEALGRRIEGGAGEYGTPVGMGSRGDELLLFTSQRCYSYRDSADTWADTGEVASVRASEPPIARTGTAQTNPDHATKSGVTVVAWEDSRGGVYCSLVESAGGRVLVADAALDADGSLPRCVAAGDVLHVYWAQASTNRIYVAVVNPASPLDALTPTILVDDLDGSNPAYDVCDTGPIYPDPAPALMAWARVGGGYRVGYVHPSGVLGSPVTGLPSVATWTDTPAGPIACAVDRVTGACVAVAWPDSTVRVRTTAYATLGTDAGTCNTSSTSGTWNRVTLEGSADGWWWAGELDGARDDLNSVETGLVAFAGTETTAPTDRHLLGHGILSRAFYDDGAVYCIVAHPVQFFPYAACVRISGDSFGGDGYTPTFYRSFVGQLPGLNSRRHLTAAQAVDPDASGLARVHTCCIGYRIQVDSENGDQFSEAGIKLARLDFAAEHAYQSAELGRGLYLASACQQHYDGRRWAEAGFHCAPDTVGGVTLAAEGAAGALGAGIYNYRFMYEEIDAQGELHPGPASVPISVTITASHKCSITVPTYRLTSKHHVRIGVFRTEANDTNEDPAYYRVSSLDPTETGDNGYITNDPTADAIAFVDNIPDATLLEREPLYTNGGILNNDPSPMAGNCIAGGKSRLYWTDPTDPHLVRYGQTLADDTGAELPASLSNQCDPYGGAIVGIGTMDGAVYAFTETAIYGFGGPGPDRNPDASADGFSPAELITSDVGCKSPNSVCQSPLGVVFQSSKGIKLLDRTRQVQDIGRDVYAFNDQTVTSATLLPDRNQIVFLTDGGFTLLWDYEHNQWSKYTNHEGLDARIVGGRYYYLRTDGRVFRETPDAYLDDNAQIRMRIETAWIKLAGYLQGWQRILWAYFIGTYKSAHALVVRYRIDYNTGYSAPIELDVNSNHNPDAYGSGPYGAGPYGGSMGDTDRYQRAIHFNVPCQAISFRIEDSEETGAAGACFDLSELLLIGGILDARAKIGPARIN